MCSGAGRSRAFTMIELMTVIALTAILFAIMVPIGTRMREDNRANMCQVNLQGVYRALKMYQLDEGGYPYLDPMAVPDAAHPNAGEPPPYHDPNDPTGPLTPESWQGRRHYGLLMLLDAGYISNPKTLQCPRAAGPGSTSLVPDTTRVSSVGPYESSYCMCLDETGAPILVTDAITGLDRAVYKYQPNRRRSEVGEPPLALDWYRQLAPRSQIDPSDSGYADFQDRYWMPQDSSIVTWCEYHAPAYSRGGQKQYIVLFHDGRIQPRPEAEFVAFDPALSRAENLENAWRNVLPAEGQ